MCLETLLEGEVCRLYCSHVFHKECLQAVLDHDSLLESARCPMCRTLVISKEMRMRLPLR